MKNKNIVIFSIVALILLFVGGGYAYKNNEAKKLEAIAKEQAAVFKREHSYTMGSDNAKVQLVEFFDPACGTCAQFHPYVKEIMQEHGENIQLVMRYAPFHNNSDKIVKMLEATKNQGMFMKTLEMLFGTQKYWINNHEPNLDALWRFLPSVGLDMEKLVEDMKNPELDKIVAQDVADAETLGATKTPSYYVNGKPLQTFGLRQLKELINSELQK